MIDIELFEKEQEYLRQRYHSWDSKLSRKLRAFELEMTTPVNRQNKPSYVKEPWLVNDDELPF